MTDEEPNLLIRKRLRAGPGGYGHDGQGNAPGLLLNPFHLQCTAPMEKPDQVQEGGLYGRGVALADPQRANEEGGAIFGDVLSHRGKNLLVQVEPGHPVKSNENVTERDRSVK